MKDLINQIKDFLAARLSAADISKIKIGKQVAGEVTRVDHFEDNPAETTWKEEYYNLFIELP